LAQSSLGSAAEFNNLGTPKLPDLPFTSGHHFSLRGNEEETRPLKMGETLETHNSQTYTGISDIIKSQQTKQNIKRNSIVTYFLMKKEAKEASSLKAFGLNRWVGFMRDLELWTIITQIKRLSDEVEKLKFQEQLLRTSFRL